MTTSEAIVEGHLQPTLTARRAAAWPSHQRNHAALTWTTLPAVQAAEIVAGALLIGPPAQNLFAQFVADHAANHCATHGSECATVTDFVAYHTARHCARCGAARESPATCAHCERACDSFPHGHILQPEPSSPDVSAALRRRGGVEGCCSSRLKHRPAHTRRLSGGR